MIVLIHGWPQTHACWRHIIEQLGRDRTVVAPDLRGSGPPAWHGRGPTTNAPPPPT
ncbi:alpha/beta fold hydrolase [Nocardia terpenica]|uniref:alpha/beta fold hydrolase n=1 Tax=Nocardia terpenica TaxID=455432 RepID=UPI002FE0EE31